MTGNTAMDRMRGGTPSSESGLRAGIRPSRAGGILLALLCSLLPLRAALQFDVFLGYDNLVREGNWFPAGCEVFNDGPPFKAVFELSTDQGQRAQVRRVLVELPTNTRKRFVIPAFASAGRYTRWNARLLDEKGKVRAELKNLTIRRDVPESAVVLGALPRSFGGLPVFPEAGSKADEHRPEVARLERNFLPDSAIALEGLQAVYLNSEQALDLPRPQVNALLTWLNAGGHLIVGVEQPADVNGTPWLAALLPLRLSGVQTVPCQETLQRFAQHGATAPGVRPIHYATTGQGIVQDPAFEAKDMPCATGVAGDGTVLVQAGGVPLVVAATRGRGRVTVLTFSPEREPFRSWTNRKWFWAQLTGLPDTLFRDVPQPNVYSQSLDGPIGAMIDSKQVRKLPVSWLLLLLTLYLLVIGPFDQWWLKKINRPMLTWVTFPAYVVCFSLLIYWIGFLLRAGETEWNELHVVDVLPRGQQADLRGRTWVSLYSPANARYQLASGDLQATLRGEYQGGWNSAQELSRAEVVQRGDGFTAEVQVPVWTSQLFVSDWIRPGATPLAVTAERTGEDVTVRVLNQSGRVMGEAWAVVGDRIHRLDRVGDGQEGKQTLSRRGGERLQDFVQQHSANFVHAADQRRNAFGNNQAGVLPSPPAHLVAASFLSVNLAPGQSNQQGARFIAPDGVDLGDLARPDQVIVLAWLPGHSFLPAIQQFNPRRSSRDTLLRAAAAVR